jgi:hypothetical protein
MTCIEIWLYRSLLKKKILNKDPLDFIDFEKKMVKIAKS